MSLRTNRRLKSRNIRRELSSFLYTENIERRVVHPCYSCPGSVGRSVESEQEDEEEDPLQIILFLKKSSVSKPIDLR